MHHEPITRALGGHEAGLVAALAAGDRVSHVGPDVVRLGGGHVVCGSIVVRRWNWNRRDMLLKGVSA